MFFWVHHFFTKIVLRWFSPIFPMAPSGSMLSTPTCPCYVLQAHISHIWLTKKVELFFSNAKDLGYIFLESPRWQTIQNSFLLYFGVLLAIKATHQYSWCTLQFWLLSNQSGPAPSPATLYILHSSMLPTQSIKLILSITIVASRILWACASYVATEHKQSLVWSLKIRR
jgi:hypothetical protein